VQHLPKDFTWKGQLNAMEDVLDQGACGSCWAVASAVVLRAHAELYQKDRTFSAEQIVACTPNPKQCGGSGGCGGATAELAMDYVAKVGLVTEDDLEYTGSPSQCPSDMQMKATGLEEASLASLPKKVSALPDVTVREGGGSKFGMTGWRKLPENKVEPLMLALYEQGPVAVSVAAGDEWSMYLSGIMDACPKEAVINHAVVLTGYGEEGENKYWQIQNSWGTYWGEGGFVRMLRHDMDEEGDYCGWDQSPEQGTACQGGPKQVWVCGSCGILYDSVVPKFSLGDEGWWSRHGLRNATV
jgi:cathepsin L